MSKPDSPLRLIRYVLWAGVFLAVVAFTYIFLSQQQTAFQSVTKKLPGAVKIGGPFKLTSHKGGVFDSTSLAGKPYLVFFGFTHCPDICPTTLLEVSKQVQALGDDAKDLQVLFITVDPERDTQDTLSKYLSSFDERIIGLTGQKSEIKRVADLFFAKYEKVASEDSADATDYTMNHTASIFLMNRKGNFAGTLDFQEQPDVRIKKLKRLIAG